MFFLKDLPSKRMIEGYQDLADDIGPKEILSALEMMRKASVLVRDIEKYFARHQLSQLKFLILVVIDREPEKDALFIHEIANKIDVSRPVITRTIKDLSDAGLVTLTGDKRDKRAKLVTLTDAGKTNLHNVLPGYFACIRKFTMKYGV